MSCYHAAKQREWLIRKHDWLSPISRPIQWCAYTDKRDGKVRYGGRFHTRSIPALTDLWPILYGDGPKVISSEYLRLFVHPVSLACLICDDGSWDKAGIEIASKQFDLSSNERLASHLRHAFGISTTVMKTGPYFHVRITAAGVQPTKDLCMEFVPDSLHYKFGPDGYATRLRGRPERACAVCGSIFRAYASSGQLFCSRRCAMIGCPKGYATRHGPTVLCRRCGSAFIPYTRRSVMCDKCRKLRVVDVPCPICGRPVFSNKATACSMACGVALGHRHRLKSV